MSFLLEDIKIIFIYQQEKIKPMSKKFLSNLVFIFFFCSCGKAQNSIASLIKVDNTELKYLLTYLDTSNIADYHDSEKDFFLKIFKIRANSYILLDNEEHIQESYFYFLVSDYGESPDIDVRLYKSKNLINPDIIDITESKDGKKFLNSCFVY